jgi:hypothetical protein
LNVKEYKDNGEIAALVRSFEDATISRDDWKHAEHMVVALYYLDGHDEQYAIDRMRSGILNLLTSGFGVDLTKEMPYHETITVFWVMTVAEFNQTRRHLPLAQRASEIVKIYDKDHPLKYYSKELLFSDMARAKYVEPDLQAAEQSAAV